MRPATTSSIGRGSRRSASVRSMLSIGVMPTPPATNTKPSERRPSTVNAPCGPSRWTRRPGRSPATSSLKSPERLDRELLAPRAGGGRRDGEGVLLEDERRAADLQPRELAGLEQQPPVAVCAQRHGDGGGGHRPDLLDDVPVATAPHRAPPPPVGQEAPHGDQQPAEPQRGRPVADQVVQPPHVQRRADQHDGAEHDVDEPPALVARPARRRVSARGTISSRASSAAEPAQTRGRRPAQVEHGQPVARPAPPRRPRAAAPAPARRARGPGGCAGAARSRAAR